MRLAEQIAEVLRPLLGEALLIHGEWEERNGDRVWVDGVTLHFNEWKRIERRLREAGIDAHAHKRGVFIPHVADVTFDIATSSFNITAREHAR